MADLQESMGIPLPVATQCEIVTEAAAMLQPAMAELIRQAARGEVLHNDDSSMPVLALRRSASVAVNDDESDAAERTGVFTSGIVSTAEKQTIALFFTGRQPLARTCRMSCSSAPSNWPHPCRCATRSRTTCPSCRRTWKSSWATVWPMLAAALWR
jgi:transposase